MVYFSSFFYTIYNNDSSLQTHDMQAEKRVMAQVTRCDSGSLL